MFGVVGDGGKFVVFHIVVVCCGRKEGWERLFCCVWYTEVVVGGVGPYRVVKCR